MFKSKRLLFNAIIHPFFEIHKTRPPSTGLDESSVLVLHAADLDHAQCLNLKCYNLNFSCLQTQSKHP